MGDYPLIVNGAKFEKTGRSETLFIMVTGYNLKGTGNAIVVPVNSNVYSIEELKAKSVSTPVGSAAWGMLLKAMQDPDIPTRSADEPGAAGRRQQHRAGPHRRPRRLLPVVGDHGIPRHRPEDLDGSRDRRPDFHGIVVPTTFAKQHPEIVDAYVNATLEAQEWINGRPGAGRRSWSEWTGIEKEVLYLYFSKGGISPSRRRSSRSGSKRFATTTACWRRKTRSRR